MNQEIVCYCSDVTKKDITEAIRQGARTLDDIRQMTGACTQGNCQEKSPLKTCCAPQILKLLNENALKRDLSRALEVGECFDGDEVR